ncbi:hypothetical protein RGQ13_01330 [Thalassotalea psychrophila]|uniref:Uncharacterized protein n=1 Tax=Thalassotalea psychrophila TaxID=3065647 RepID=A0ABY9TV90_9GAMM|nr:hypothetical protein RGQ13_01330 [Colwelliaceae bacterium SQ149]
MSFFDMLRERDELAEQVEMKATITNIMAERFEPKEDISPYEIALILKAFSIVSVNGLSEETKQMMIDNNLDRHFLPAE